MKQDNQRRCTLEDLLEDRENANTRLDDETRPWPAAGQLAEVLEQRHCSLVGRVQVQWEVAGRSFRQWVPCLQDLSPRAGDRVLLQQPQGALEPVVVGILDGFEERPKPKLRGPSVELRADESLTIVGHRGRPLLQIREGLRGPEVRLLRKGLSLDVDGPFCVNAESISLRATRGNAEVEAVGDVEVRGELIHLN